MINHVQSLEDSVIALSDNEDRTMEQKKEKIIAMKTIRKRQNKEEEQKKKVIQVQTNQIIGTKN